MKSVLLSRRRRVESVAWDWRSRLQTIRGKTVVIRTAETSSLAITTGDSPGSRLTFYK